MVSYMQCRKEESSYILAKKVAEHVYNL